MKRPQHPDDIYKQVGKPPMEHRRRRGGRRRVRQVGATSASPGTSARRHRKFSDPENPGNRFGLWAAVGMLVLLVAYAGFLILLRKGAGGKRLAGASPTAHAATPIPEVMVPPRPTSAPPAGPSRAAALEEEVAALEASLASIIRLKVTVKPEEALQGLDALLRQQPATPFLHELNQEIARRTFLAGDYSNAVERLLGVVRVDPRAFEARMMLAAALLKTRDFEGAEVVARWNLKTDPYSVELHQIIADSLIARDQPENALPHLRTIAEKAPFNIVLQNQYAVALERSGRYERALTLFSKLLEQEPENTATWFNLAVAHVRHGALEKAVETLDLAAQRCGARLVYSLMAGAEFDPLRGNEAFDALYRRLGGGQ